MVRLIRELGTAEDAPAIWKIVQSDQPLELRRAALAAWGRHAPNNFADVVLPLYADWPEALQTDARGLLLARRKTALALLTEVDHGRVDPKSIAADELRRVALHQDERLDALVLKHWGSVTPGTPEEKLAEMRRLNNDLRAGPGHLLAGRAVFKKTCGTCHELYGEGGKLGPGLTHANRNDTTFLLGSLVDPNAQIRREYLSRIVVTTDGRVYSGLIVDQSAGDVTVADAKDQRTVIPRREIATLSESRISLMPENILKTMSPAEMRNLFAYLQSTKPPADLQH